MRVALQMDAINTIKFATDSTLMLGIEAQKRGHPLFYYQPTHAFLKNGVAYAKMHPITLRYEQGNHYTLGEAKITPLSEMDIILMRQDPPFDMHYLTYTYWLERLENTRVINPPKEVRNCPEKLFVNEFKEHIPETLITADTTRILEFYEEHQNIILKPLYSFGGNDVFHLQPGSDNVEAMAAALMRLHQQNPIIAQRFIPQIREEGDIRVILIDGEVVGALRRIPAQHSVRSNIAAGGRGERTQLSKTESKICEDVGKQLKKRNIIFAGLDLIGGYLTEINITSPTGLQVINRLENTQLESIFWDAVEK